MLQRVPPDMRILTPGRRFFSSSRTRAPCSAALMAAIKPGAAILTTSLINPTGFNPGSINVADRIDEANSYLVFTSMAAIGGIQNRFGNPFPSPSYRKGNPLPWTNASLVNSDGCAYASAIVNFVDSIGVLAGQLLQKLLVKGVAVSRDPRGERAQRERRFVGVGPAAAGSGSHQHRAAKHGCRLEQQFIGR